MTTTRIVSPARQKRSPKDAAPKDAAPEVPPAPASPANGDGGDGAADAAPGAGASVAPSLLKLNHIEGTKAGLCDVVDVGTLPKSALTLGRDPDCVLAYDPYKDPRVSAVHATIVYDAKSRQFTITDGGSTNGTRLNGLKIYEPTRLHDGDEVELGRKGAKFVVEIPAAQVAAAEEGKSVSALAREQGAPRVPRFTTPDDSPLARSLHQVVRDARLLAQRLGHRPTSFARAAVAEASRASLTVRSVVFAAALLGLAALGALGWLSATLSDKLSDAEATRHTLQTRVVALEAELAQKPSAYDPLKESYWAIKNRHAALLEGDEPAAIDADQLRRALDFVGREFERFRRANPKPAQAFATARARFERSIFLVLARVTLINRHGTKFTCQGLGTAFMASAQGHLITNKHVIEPWKFGPVAAAVDRQGLRVVETTYSLFAWPAGTAALAPDGSLREETGYSLAAGTLQVHTTRRDRFVYEDVDGRGAARVHETDAASDLAVLRLTTSPEPYPPLPLYRGDPKALAGAPNSPVFTLGYPRRLDHHAGKALAPTAAVGTLVAVGPTLKVTLPILQGNSGGPLLALDPKTGALVVVGIVTRMVSGKNTRTVCLRIKHALPLLPTAPDDDDGE